MTMRKSLLIITPYFAPQSHAAVFRAYKLAKYLPSKGWDVHILTIDKNYLYNEDPHLLSELPASVKIHTATYIEPTLRGLRMALGGKDRSFQSFRKTVEGANQIGVPYKASLFRKFYQFLLRKAHNPDAYWTWKRPALKKATELIRENQIQVILTSSSPYTTLEIGSKLKKQFGLRWIADFRDPFTYDVRLHSEDPKIYSKQKFLEEKALREADVVTTAASSQPMIFADMYGVEKAAKGYHILTGLDSNLLRIKKEPSSEKSFPYFIFTGEFLPQYGDEFFKILKETVKSPEIQDLHLHVKFVGRKELNEPRVRPLARKHGVEDMIEFIDHLPQDQLYSLIDLSLAALICTSRSYPWWTAFAKVADYVALKKPVVAVIPNPSEARKWLQLTGLGIFLDGDLTTCSKRLADFILHPQQIVVIEEYQKRFLVDHQINEFEKVFLGQESFPT